MSSEEFVMVHHRKKCGKRVAKKKDAVSSLEFYSQAAPEVDAKFISEKLRSSRLVLYESEFTQRNLRNTLRDAGLLKSVDSSGDCVGVSLTIKSVFSVLRFTIISNSIETMQSASKCDSQLFKGWSCNFEWPAARFENLIDICKIEKSKNLCCLCI